MELIKFKVGELAGFYYRTTTDISSYTLGTEINVSGNFVGDTFEVSGSSATLSNSDFEIKILGSYDLFVFIKQSSLGKRGFGSIHVDIGSGTETFDNGFIVGADWDVPVSMTYSYNEQDKILTVTRTPLDSSGNPVSGLSAKIDTFIYDNDNNGRVKEINEILE